MTNKLKIIDYVMGTGKTRFILNKLATDVSKRFIYVAPILSEIESRAKDELAGVAVGVPSDKNSTKGADMLEMLEQGINVACTHSLLQSLTTKHIDLIKEWDYVLVIDEVVDFISAFNQYTKDSISDLFDDGKLIADEDNKGKISMNWDVREHNHFGALKNMCDTGMIYSSKRPSDMLNIQIPPSVLSAACEVYVLTYMYEASTMCKFMEIHNFTYEKMIYPELVQLERTIKQNIKALINIIDIRAVDTLFNRQKNTTFSQSWYVKVGKNKEVVQLENKAITIKMLDKIDNYLSNNTEKRQSYFYCLPKTVNEQLIIGDKKRVDIKGDVIAQPKFKYLKSRLKENKSVDYSDSMTQSIKEDIKDTAYQMWLPVNTRATNKYADRTFCMYLMNLYPNVPVQRYLHDYHTPIDVDKYALSEMLQFIWRGCIRKGEPMDLYILSSRMKGLFLQWLNE